MRHSTTNTYELKCGIIHCSERISEGVNKDWQKFTGDMLFGISASRSCILSRMTDALREAILKQNTIERLARKLNEDMPAQIIDNYLGMMKGIAAEESPIFVDDSDVIKPYGKSFEALGRVRDGSSPDSRLEKGYIVTEAVALSAATKQPFSIFSRIHSSAQKD